MDTELSPQDAAKALKEAQAKGLPEGWSVKLDVSIVWLMNYVATKYFAQQFVYFRNDVEGNGLPQMANPAIPSLKRLLSP